jgi:hypothetical protein
VGGDEAAREVEVGRGDCRDSMDMTQLLARGLAV